MPNPRYFLSAKNIHWVFSIIGISLVIFVLIFSWMSWNHEEKDAENDLSLLVELSGKLVNSYFSHYKSDLSWLGQAILETNPHDLKRINVLLKRFQEANEDVGNINFIDVNGQIIASLTAAPKEGYPNISNQSSFNLSRDAFLNGESFNLGRPIFGVLFKEWFIPVRYGIRDRQGRLRYILSANLTLTKQQIFWQSLYLPKSVQFGLVRDDGFPLSLYPEPKATDLEDAYEKVRTGPLAAFLKQHDFPKNGLFTGFSKLTQLQSNYAYSRLPNFPVTLYVATPVSNLTEKWWRHNQQIYLLTLLFSLSGFGVYIWATNRQAKQEEERKRIEAALLEQESQYRIALETSVDGFWMVDMQGHLVQVNEAAARQLGYSRAELLNMTVPEIDAIERPEETAAHIEEVMRDGYSRFESEHRRKDGSIFPVQVVTTFSPMNGGRIFVFITDLSKRRASDEALRLAAMVYENSSEAILVSDADNRIVAVNPAFEKMTGYKQDEIRGKNPGMFKSDRQGKEFYQAMWQALNAEGHWHGEVWDKRKNGELHAKLLTINTIKDKDGTVFRYVALFTDITERKAFEELVWKQANFDTLTKLPNRHMFHDRLEQEAKKSHRAGLTMALMLIDLDRFKEVNDTLGHDRGDLLLIEAAKRISDCVRESDTVARLGGDEFTVILSELDDVTSAERTAQNIIDQLTRPFTLGTDEAFISASIGISLYPDDAEALDVLFKNADQAMYAAKNAGRNRFSYFTSDLQVAAQKRLRLTTDLRLALTRDEFRVYYQPIVDMASGQIYKAEALIRWQHPEQGMISPMDFIPLAEETGLIVPIGNWVFEQSVQQVKHWRNKYHAQFQISVNKSPVQIRHDDTVHVLWPDYLKRQGISGQCITVEITEGLLLNAESKVNEKLLHFRDAGIQVSIDDFGTGYSSLSYLKKFDIDYLKIDQSFVRNLGADKNDLALCEAIIVMAHKLGFKVVAEGVETTLQRDLLQAAGCDYAQGYLYSRPVPAAEFEQMMSNTCFSG